MTLRDGWLSLIVRDALNVRTTLWNSRKVSLALEALKREFDRFTAQDATFIFVTNEIGMEAFPQ